jgi:hypothetical protein
LSYLRGKDNYAADRAEAARLMEAFPLLALRARQNRLFLVRAVTRLAEQDIRQIVDIGCGLPAAQNTPSGSQAAHPDCHVGRKPRQGGSREPSSRSRRYHVGHLTASVRQCFTNWEGQ